MTPDEEEKYKKFTKSIQRRAATIGGNDMNDYPLKMLIFNRARMVKNSKNRIPLELSYYKNIREIVGLCSRE